MQGGGVSQGRGCKAGVQEWARDTGPEMLGPGQRVASAKHPSAVAAPGQWLAGVCRPHPQQLLRGPHVPDKQPGSGNRAAPSGAGV